MKLTKILNEEQKKALNDFYCAIFEYDEAVRVEYFVAGYLSALKNKSASKKMNK